jgi:hypothetical protein
MKFGKMDLGDHGPRERVPKPSLASALHHLDADDVPLIFAGVPFPVTLGVLVTVK